MKEKAHIIQFLTEDMQKHVTVKIEPNEEMTPKKLFKMYINAKKVLNENSHIRL